MRQSITFLVICVLLLVGGAVSAASITDDATNIEPTKSWTIQFNSAVDAHTVNEQTIYVTNNTQEEDIAVTHTVDGDTVHVSRVKPYNAGHTYTLVITNGVKSTTQLALAEQIEKKFTIQGAYATATVDAAGNVAATAHFTTFDEAMAARQAGDVILRDGHIIYMERGVVSTTALITKLYTKPDLKLDYAGVTTHTEMLYVGATDEYVQVDFAGQMYYVKHQDILLLPNIPLQSYYSVTDAGLVHSIYNHNTKAFASYVVSAAPSFLQKGNKYYSTDGFTFYDEAGTFVGESYSYFQYVSPRTVTSYSAEQLDAYVMTVLAERERSGVTRYKDATTKSALIGIGEQLKTIEAQSRINALLILSLAIHEGDYGMSCHAQKYNNTFGLHVTDSNTACQNAPVDTTNKKYFSSIEKNIEAFAKHLNDTYLNVNNMANYIFNGLAFGNKMVGMNVRYATDPYWGAKAAGHMYRLDNALGGHDYKKHTLGITTQAYVSTRKAPSATAERAYQYRVDGTIKRLDRMPLTLSTTPSHAASWTRLVSELQGYADDVYTVNANVRIIETH